MAHHSIPELPATSKMAALIGAKDWSKTALGAADTWPPSLTLVVNLILASGFPMAVRWGPDFVMIYNDGYQPILGEKHPWALGRPFAQVWPEVQPQLKPLHEAILAGTRGAFFAQDLLLRIQRHGAEWEDARFTISYSPIPDAAAQSGVSGVIITAVETTDRAQMEEALRASEERFSGIFRQTSVGVVQCGLDGRFLLVNKRFCDIAARTESELLSCRVADLTHPDDAQENVARLKRLAADGKPFIAETRCVRPDGSAVWISSNVALTRDGEGRPQHFVAVVHDISEHKRAQEQQQLLMGELNHRVKNLFAIADSMVSLSARSARTTAELTKEIHGRLRALAIAHEIILPDPATAAGARMQSTGLDNLLRKILSPYDGGSAGENGRLVLSGPAVEFGARAATNLALVLHEFATNAAKYGALSVPEGSIRISWSENQGLLTLRWEERGGPALAGPPVNKGFGTLLSGHSIRSQLGGSLSHDWNPSGLVIDLSLPVERLRD
jgi:PAS domain S-box-containing protein